MLGDHVSLFLKREATIEQMQLAVWQILLERFRASRSKDRVILASKISLHCSQEPLGNGNT